MWSRQEVCQYSGAALDWAGQPISLPAATPGDSDKIIEFFERAAAADSAFRWAIILRDDDEFAGTVGFNSLSPAAELAFHLRPEFWGLGLMREAAQLAVGWLWMRLPTLWVEAFIEAENVSSRRLARRLGFQLSGVVGGLQRYVLAPSPEAQRKASEASGTPELEGS